MVKTYSPKTLAEALIIRSEASPIPFAGGTDLMVKHKSIGGALPDFPNDLLFIGDLTELKGIERSEQGFQIGSAVKLADLLSARNLPDYLKKSIRGIGSPAIRNMGTLGGNICNASPAGDTLPVLYALDAVVELSSLIGTRSMMISNFIKGPGRTEIKPDEILTRIFIPSFNCRKWSYRKLGVRKANAISKLTVFFIANIDQLTIKDIRIAFGSVGPTVKRSRPIEKKMIGLSLENLTYEIADIIEAYGNLISPISDVRSTKAYRSDVALGILREMIEKELIS